MRTKALLALCTCPDQTVAREIANAMVERQLAACVNILPGLVSVYQWQGKTEESQEALLVIKTSEDRYQDLEESLHAMHPYELPEIIAVSVERGLEDYLQWIQSCTKITN